jgi:hypothetical protein
MGGGYYDRDVGSTTSTDKKDFDYSAYTPSAQKAMSRREMDWSLLPRNRQLTCANENPIVVAIDVTGSMGDWSKIIWDKMPMFYGQLLIQGYLKDPSLSFAAIGDAMCDKAPLQVCDFAQGNELDEWLSKIWLEGGGGGQHFESYELAAYFYARHTTLQKPTLPFFFFTGDEGFYPAIKAPTIQNHFGDASSETMLAKTAFAELKEKFNVFLLHKDYGVRDKVIVDQWSEVLGKERILVLPEPKAVVDVMLGAIALMSETRDLETYAADLKNREQTNERIELVQKSLAPLSQQIKFKP